MFSCSLLASFSDTYTLLNNDNFDIISRSSCMCVIYNLCIYIYILHSPLTFYLFTLYLNLTGGRLADKSFKEFKDKEEIARDREARERGGSRAGSRGNDTNTSSSFSAKKAPPHAIIGKGSTTGSQSNANRGTVRGQTDCALFDSLISGYIAIPGVGKTFSATELDIILNSLPCKASDKGAGLSWQVRISCLIFYMHSMFILISCIMPRFCHELYNNCFRFENPHSHVTRNYFNNCGTLLTVMSFTHIALYSFSSYLHFSLSEFFQSLLLAALGLIGIS